MISPRDQSRPRSISKITVNDLDHIQFNEKITEGDLNDTKYQAADLDLYNMVIYLINTVENSLVEIGFLDSKWSSLNAQGHPFVSFTFGVNCRGKFSKRPAAQCNFWPSCVKGLLNYQPINWLFLVAMVGGHLFSSVTQQLTQLPPNLKLRQRLWLSAVV